MKLLSVNFGGGVAKLGERRTSNQKSAKPWSYSPMFYRFFDVSWKLPLSIFWQSTTRRGGPA